MIIYKDLLTGDEMFTDSSKVNLVEDCLYEVTCRHVVRKQGDFVLDGANPSAEGEDADEGADDSQVESGLDLVLNQRLMETHMDLKSYKLYLKTYSQALKAKWAEMEMSEEQIEQAKTKMMAAVKLILPKVPEAKFYTGESGNPDGMIGVLDYRDDADGNEVPLMLFIKHGLDAEKV